MDQPLLHLQNMIGFGGAVPSGLKVHKDQKHLVYSVGCTIVIEDITSGRQEFLSGHTNNVSCIAVSKSGRYIASGQVTHMGYQADIIIWDFNTKSMYCKLVLHRNDVGALAFSPNDKYLVSLGGQDDGCVVVWNVDKKEAICGSQAQVMSAGAAHTIVYANNNDEVFVTGGSGTLRVWQLDLEGRKIRPSEVRTGQLKRTIRCIEMAEDDSYFYCGTTTGDILRVNMQSYNCQSHGPEKDRFSLGICSLVILKTGEILVGAGDGTVAVVTDKFKRTKKVKKVVGAVTSIALRGSGHQFFVGTDQCNIYRFNSEFDAELTTTCHYDVVNDIAFPHNCSDLVVTCSKQDVRVWDIVKGKELRRISVPNMTCNAVALMKDGSNIITGWDDGCIRAFFPETGRPMFTMENSYGGSVTALATYYDCTKVVSGSKQGHVVVWDVPRHCNPNKGPVYVTSHSLMKEHKAAVTSIQVKKDDTECVTSSIDGSCIIWDLLTRSRRQMIRVNNLFKYVCYHPEEHQVLTTGTDRKIGYWEVFDGSMIRELDGSMSGSVNAMNISANGRFFVSAGDDKLIKLWKYDEGETTHIGIGHSAAVTGIKISPDERFVVSVSADGAILKWSLPCTV